MNALRQAFISAGSNLGDRATTLCDAMEQLRGLPGIAALEMSSLYETEPVGVTDQPRFLNLVAGVQTALSPKSLLSALQMIEQEHGRERTVRWGPRTLDLDLLVYEGEQRDTPALQLPHPRMFARAFVIVPLREVLAQPAFRRPSWDELRARITAPLPDEQDVRKLTLA